MIADVNGTTLYYETRGEGSPLVFVNPGALDCRAWDDQWDPLAKGHVAIRYDPRGWGRSGDARESFSPSSDLAALLSFAGIDRAHLVGASWGASLALDFALAHAKQVQRLVLLGGAPSGVPIPPEAIAKFRPIVTALREDPARGVDLWLSTPGLGLPDAPPAVTASVRANALDNLRYWSIDPRAMRPLDPPAKDRLREVEAPTLVLVGDRDQDFLQSMADILASTIPRAMKRVIPGAGHLANLENPEAFNREVLAFLKD